jgi:hypothetical protein
MMPSEEAASPMTTPPAMTQSAGQAAEPDPDTTPAEALAEGTKPPDPPAMPGGGRPPSLAAWSSATGLLIMAAAVLFLRDAPWPWVVACYALALGASSIVWRRYRRWRSAAPTPAAGAPARLSRGRQVSVYLVGAAAVFAGAFGSVLVGSLLTDTPLLGARPVPGSYGAWLLGAAACALAVAIVVMAMFAWQLRRMFRTAASDRSNPRR